MEYATPKRVREKRRERGKELHLLSESFVVSRGNSVERPLASTLILIVQSPRNVLQYTQPRSRPPPKQHTGRIRSWRETTSDETPVLQRDTWLTAPREIACRSRRTMSDTGCHTDELGLFHAIPRLTAFPRFSHFNVYPNFEKNFCIKRVINNVINKMISHVNYNWTSIRFQVRFD